MIRIGPGWFYYGCTLQAHLRNLDDLVWFYRLDRELGTHGVQVGTAHQMILRFRDGSELLVSLAETANEVSRGIGKLVEHLPGAAPFAGVDPGERTDVPDALRYFAPWALVGPDEARERAWRNPRTRGDLIALVERRKQDARAGS